MLQPPFLSPKHPRLHVYCQSLICETSIPPAVGGSPKLEEDKSRREEAPLKRKASLVDDNDSPYTKRQRQDDDDRSPPRRRPSIQSAAQDRRASATQEEKKRGKRLFGGLLSTLSQTSTNSQHKRRQEIERRQQERMQKQRDEDDKKRADKVARIKETRIVEHIDFEEQVVSIDNGGSLQAGDKMNANVCLDAEQALQVTSPRGILKDKVAALYCKSGAMSSCTVVWEEANAQIVLPTVEENGRAGRRH